MKKVDGKYFSNLENKLFRGYEEYMNGINKYINFIEGAIVKCNEKKYTELVMEIVVKFVFEITMKKEFLRP